MSYKKFYSDYVEHMVRFFLTCPDGIQVREHTKVDVINWKAVQLVWSMCGDQVKRIMIEYVKQPAPGEKVLIQEKVRTIANRERLTIDAVWHKIKRFEQCVAQVRKLI